ncbi:hypothetical protein M0R45_002137 [Rubus argutus]|uniref:Uncharacterized protein n=1 Tax=Rubus argutus TaxID=59490 RepID=A0AAW1VIW8_RUBAR
MGRRFRLGSAWALANGGAASWGSGDDRRTERLGVLVSTAQEFWAEREREAGGVLCSNTHAYWVDGMKGRSGGEGLEVAALGSTGRTRLLVESTSAAMWSVEKGLSSLQG